jgi:hypothetical protein
MAVHIDLPAADEKAVGVLVNASIPQLGEAEDALQHQQRVLDLGTHFRLGAVLRPLRSARYQ